MGENIARNIRKNLSSKYSQKILDHTKIPAVDALETAPRRAIQKTAVATGDLIDNRIADKTTKVQKIHHRIFQK